jgi:hypothetical protein
MWLLASVWEMIASIPVEVRGITKENLIQTVDLSNEYTLKSPEMRILFEVILEMDLPLQEFVLKFITGSSWFAIGELAT